MKVMKFGGTSVGSALRMKNLSEMIAGQGKNLVVLSAMSGTTNSLVEIAGYLYRKNIEGANELINALENKYNGVVGELFADDLKEGETYRAVAEAKVGEIFTFIRSLTKGLFTSIEEKSIIAQGELLSTNLFCNYLNAKGVKAVLLPALDYMRTDKQGEPDLHYIAEHLKPLMQTEADLFLTQGFICRNAYGEIDNLTRGGSDYTASLVGAALQADEIQIWTDIDGMHNNDPRVVDNTRPVHFLNFDEAAELAYFGAKILHPTCILPAKLAQIPVRLLNTLQPDAPGTLISNRSEIGKIKAVAAKDNITAIKIKSGRMLLAYGFLRRVFEIFESYQTPIDMICTSEVGISMTIDNNSHLNEILDELRQVGTVTVDTDMVIICVVGDLRWDNIGFETRVMDALKEIPVRMISFGGSNFNISLLVKAEDKKRTLKALSKHLFDED